MHIRALGKVYEDGATVVRQGEMGDCMFVIQSGKMEVVREDEGKETRLSVLGSGDVFGEMALFDRQPRSATVRALGQARALTVDKKTFLRRVHEDPSLAFRILENMSKRIRSLDGELAQLRSSLGQPDNNRT
ncbi:MAG: cyclic nucleotide-binding domain-containing protein [Chloroflexi bacterium]|nr:cyclic nucleotide-binding domain-containing protein [Chloroflexota bacterium]